MDGNFLQLSLFCLPKCLMKFCMVCAWKRQFPQVISFLFSELTGKSSAATVATVVGSWYTLSLIFFRSASKDFLAFSESGYPLMHLLTNQWFSIIRCDGGKRGFPLSFTLVPHLVKTTPKNVAFKLWLLAYLPFSFLLDENEDEEPSLHQWCSLAKY